MKQIGDDETARSYFEEVLAYEDTNPMACSGMAHLMAKEGRVTEALAWLDEVMDEIGENRELQAEKEYLLENAVVASKKEIYDSGSYTLEEYNADGSTTSKYYDRYGELSSESVNDADGNTLSSFYYSDGSLASESKWEYDDEGNPLSYQYIDYRYTDSSYRTEYKYAQTGSDGYLYDQITEYYMVNGTECVRWWYETVYDKEGWKWAERSGSCDETGQTTYWEVTEYNSYGDVIAYESGSNPTGLQTYTNYDRQYDSDGRLIYAMITYGDTDSSQDFYYPDQEEYTEETYEYGADGNAVYYTSTYVRTDYWGARTYYYTEGESSYYADGTLAYERESSYDYSSYGGSYYGIPYIYENTYDEEGRLVRYSYTDKDGFSGSTDFVYDENGNEISTVSQDSSGYHWENIYDYDYEYDAFGNVIRESYSASAGYSSVTIYEYTYKID